VKRAIVVVTDRTEGAVGWHEDLAHSLRTCIYRIETYRPSVPQVAAGGLELQAWLWAAAHHDEFVLLPQRALVKDWAPLKQAFEEEGMGVSFADQPWPFGHFLGKYVSVHLRQLLAPTALADSPTDPEGWCRAYARVAPYAQLGHFGSPDASALRFEERHGELVLRLECDWLTLFLPGEAQHSEDGGQIVYRRAAIAADS